MNTPINNGILQSDLDCAGFDLLNFSGSTGSAWTGSAVAVTNIRDEPYSAAGDGVTDDTDALQAAIDDLAALGGGRIYFPAGEYVIGGALQETGGRNAQILLPVVATDRPHVVIELVGALSPPTQFSYSSPDPQSTAYSIIRSTLTGGTGTAAFIAGKDPSTGIPFNDTWDNVMLVVRDLIFQAPPNPSFTAFNCYDIIGPQFYNVLIHAGGFAALDITEPTNTNATAIKLARSNHSAQQQVKVVDIFGFYTGIQDGELASITANIWGCKQGVKVTWNNFPSVYRTLGLYWCPTGIIAAGSGYTGMSGDNGTHYMRVDLCDLEHTNELTFGQAWQQQTYDIDDASNLLIGDLKWASLTSFVGNDHILIKNGGTQLLTSEVGGNMPIKSYLVSQLPTGILGAIAVVVDGGGSLAWGATVTGGGSTKYLVWYSGSNWTVFGK